MSKINVGDYVRTKNGYIGKIYNINEFREPSMMYAIDIPKTDDFVFMGEKDFKSSPRIIELIQVGDYVNEEKVCCFRKENCDYDIGFQYNDDWGEWYGIDADEIKTIVTKEQFEAMEYKIIK